MKLSGNCDVCVRFGKAIRERRLELGWLKEKLSYKADLNRTYIGDIERGVRNVSLRNIEKISKALRLSMTELSKRMEKER